MRLSRKSIWFGLITAPTAMVLAVGGTAAVAEGPGPEPQVGDTITGADAGNGVSFCSGSSTHCENGTLTHCNDSWTSHVVYSYGTDEGWIAKVDSISFTNCEPGTSVTAVGPISFSVGPTATADMGIDVNITTPRGTCEYRGGADGYYNDHDGYMVAFASNPVLFQRSSGCGGPDQITMWGSGQIISDANGEAPAL